MRAVGLTVLALLAPTGRASAQCVDVDGDLACDVACAAFPLVGERQFSPVRQDLTGSVLGVGDLDGDGYPDMLLGDTWARNVGDAFGDPSLSTFECYGDCFAVTATDWDADGDLDVITATVDWADDNGDDVRWHENLGGGAFASAVELVTTMDWWTSLDAVDLDGDGDEDLLATGDYASYHAIWLENLGDGTAAYHGIGLLPYDAKYNNQSVVAGDVDSDGDMDVVTGHPSTGLAWFENLGAGTFGAEALIDPASTLGVAVEDVDGDGALDLIAANADLGQVVWYSNLGAVVFAAAQTVGPSSSSSVSVADLDLDGDVDVLSGLSWFANSGGGAFGAGVSLDGGYAEEVATADVDLDGDPEILFQSGYSASWLDNRRLVSAPDADLDGIPNVCDVCAAATDVDGDGALDDCDLCPGSDDRVDTDGDGSPDDCDYCPIADDTDGDGVCGDVDLCLGDDARGDLDGDGWCQDLDVCRGDDATGDADGDRVCDDLDLCAAGDDRDADGDGVPTGCDACPGSPWDDGDGDGVCDDVDDCVDPDLDGVCWEADACHGADDAEDVDADGVPDLCDDCPDAYDPWQEHAFDGATWLIADLSSARATAVGDLDGDGREDVVYEDLGVMWWFRTFADGTTSLTAMGAGLTDANPQMVDLDADGDQDLVVWTFDELIYLENLGGGVLSLQLRTTAYLGKVVVIDVDGDADLDLLAETSNSGQMVWWENAAGSLLGKTTLKTGIQPAMRLVPADLDADGAVDLAASLYYGVGWYRNLGGGSFSGFEQFEALDDDTWHDLAVGDLDADGDLDLVGTLSTYGYGIQTESELLRWENLGGGVFGASETIASDVTGSSVVALADLDLDGALEVITPDGWFRNHGAWTFSAAQPFDEDRPRDGVSVADLDGDGDPDVVSSYATQLEWFENHAAQRPADADADGECDASDPCVDTDGDGVCEVVGP